MECKRERKKKESRSRFKYVPKQVKVVVPKIDPRCQEATPELLRIEIDQVFKEFLDDPDRTEHIFPSDLNNLQRKYIHAKAQEMNIISKSHGKEPNRKLHIKKKSKQLTNQSFVISPCQSSTSHLNEFLNTTLSTPLHIPPHRRFLRKEKVIGKLANGMPTVPVETYTSRDIQRIRNNLPIFEKKRQVVETIKHNQIVIISSETGSGKTTQVPQYIMDDMMHMRRPCKIICTQPRRISTVAAAERVSYERGDSLGESVGYHIKLEQKYGIHTNLVYCTTGIFLRNLMYGDEVLHNITHIIIDEVHERDKLSDFLLICLKRSMVEYPRLKIILMSATMNINKFLEYFGKGEVLSIPGRLFPIDTLYLEEILYLTKYMSPKMREAQKKEQVKEQYNLAEDVASAVLLEENPLVDEALDEYLNFSENYDYRVHYEEATAQLGMYFLSEGVSVDYQHSGNGRTALMIAAFLGDKEFISRLCNMGANLNLSCKMGKTAFEYASENPDTLRLLEYIKGKRSHGTNDKDDIDNEKERLLQLFDKTTSDELIDFDLLVRLISFIHNSDQEGSILVFLPGYDDIMMVNDRIMLSQLNPDSYQTFFLHSSMNIRDQHDVFVHLPGKRKIILSTNIAETSITIDDVVFVIDTGKAKEKCYDSYNKVSSLQTRWISKSCANQRMGRAGRTKPGMCFRLFSKQRFENMDDERIPEILRVSLEELCLHAKVIAPDDMNIHNFLTMAPDPPSMNSIKVAIENLQFLGALDKEEDMTVLGEYLAQLTIEPQLGKMLLVSVICRCLEPILTLTAAMTHKDPFQLPPQANLKSQAGEKRKELLDDVMSDHLLYLMVFKKWQEEYHKGNVSDFCHKYFISHPTMTSILETRSQLLGQLRAAGFINQSSSIEEYNRNANCWPLVKAIICTGLYPNLAYPLHQNLATRSEKKVCIQSSSACSRKHITTWLVYDELIKHRNVLMIRGVSAVTTITVGLMCGIYTINPTPNSISLDDWLEFEFPDTGVIHLRSSLTHLIDKVLANPMLVYNDRDYLLLQTLCKVLEAEEVFADLKPPLSVGDKPKFFLPPQNGFMMRQRNRTKQIAYTNRPKRGRYFNGWTAPRNAKPGPRAIMSQGGNYDYDNACSSMQNMRLNAADRLMNGLTKSEENGESSNVQGVLHRGISGVSAEEKFGDYPDDSIFILIRPRHMQNIEIAYQTCKWIFAPQTEKKILYFKNKKKTVYLIFTVNLSQAFQGLARFITLLEEKSGKPTACVEWICKISLDFSRIRQLKNPYNAYRPIYEGSDGQVIEQNVAQELLRIYTHVSHSYEK